MARDAMFLGRTAHDPPSVDWTNSTDTEFLQTTNNISTRPLGSQLFNHLLLLGIFNSLVLVRVHFDLIVIPVDALVAGQAGRRQTGRTSEFGRVAFEYAHHFAWDDIC